MNLAANTIFSEFFKFSACRSILQFLRGKENLSALNRQFLFSPTPFQRTSGTTSKSWNVLVMSVFLHLHYQTPLYKGNPVDASYGCNVHLYCLRIRETVLVRFCFPGFKLVLLVYHFLSNEPLIVF